jgi:Zn-dependent protease with chaperone function
VLTFAGEPVGNIFSRWEEHAADVYGLAITRPVTPDAGQVAAQAFQLLGERSYSYPAPSRLMVFWYYSHPTIADRIRFVLASGGPGADGGVR